MPTKPWAQSPSLMLGCRLRWGVPVARNQGAWRLSIKQAHSFLLVAVLPLQQCLVCWCARCAHAHVCGHCQVAMCTVSPFSWGLWSAWGFCGKGGGVRSSWPPRWLCCTCNSFVHILRSLGRAVLGQRSVAAQIFCVKPTRGPIRPKHQPRAVGQSLLLCVAAVSLDMLPLRFFRVRACMRPEDASLIP